MSEYQQFPSAVPPGPPPSVLHGQRVLSAVVWAATIVLLVGCSIASIVVITTETGALGLVTGLVLAAIPVFPVVSLFLWLDRYEAEPASLLALAFAWGAGVSTFGALVINSASVRALELAGGDITLAAVVVAPIVEETLKALAVVAVLLLRRREFDGIVDGIVYAGLAGVGFAFVENVLYLGRALLETGGTGAAFVFVMRCVVSPFAHPLFTAATGIGLGIAARTRNGPLKVLAPVAGWLVAVSLHGAWNLSASSGLSGFVVVYVLVQVPVFLGFVVLAVLARRREGRLIGRHLQLYGSTGWLAEGEVVMLASLPARREARRWAAQVGGPEGHQAMRQFQVLGSELAFLRERMVRGTAASDALQQEHAMLTTMARLRDRFTPRWPRLG
ncbi:MAG: PrsW family intramembrane metalloprotease [Actinomycetales bacterium]|nr:PrsW family intramembrane metalloprotease [Actinomycetales bacterium]